MKRIVINGDDFGLSDGICRAIRELLDAGAISNTTLMTAAPDALDRCRKWRVPELLGIAGVHLQLSGGAPLSPLSEVSSFSNPASGNFLPRQSLTNVNPVEVESEWRRQIEAAADLLGGRPTHLDSHQGVHRLPGCFDVYLSLAREYGLSVRGGMGEDYVSRMKANGVVGSTVLLREWTGGFHGTDELKATLVATAAKMEDADVVELVTHPAYWDEYLQSHSSLNLGREGDRTSLHELATEGWLARNNFRMVSFPSLA
ncbi:ChbG/HpnK family deacetylase [Catellatospora sichuanensis]|uniref:carbohydrate deacetylase n=1 Tax=Catellatospora sichuanensis TaxID=1969805 RepID=UPI0011838A27